MFFQHVIPQTLLDHYVSMTEPAKAQTIDTEIVRHCAFSLPAVALTLGRKNWPCLRDTYELLTSDMQVGQAFSACTIPQSPRGMFIEILKL